tara:strand:+ start:274 stop:879 length:606 start_codon:yes stop_codon:yes gene_type:complete
MKKNDVNNSKRIIWYDFETDGFNPYHGSIIEIGAIDNFDNKFSIFIKPTKPISAKIEDITGITNKILYSDGVSPKVGLNLFNEFINMYDNKFVNSTYLIAHNNDSFDKLFLIYQFKKYNISLRKIKYLDTLRLAQFVLDNLTYHNMNSLCKYFNIQNMGAHRALNDAIALKDIYFPLITIFKQQYNTKNIDTIIDKLANPF